jgi:catechol 2,3-dioxygenase-like lactoylglutathione lyase family enzyme
MKAHIGHVSIRAKDVEETAAFYRDVLGFPEAFRMLNPAGTELANINIYIAEGQFIEILPGGIADSTNRNANTAGIQNICIEVDNIITTFDHLKQQGAPIDSEIRRAYLRGAQFETHDPDGNIIKFMQVPPDSLRGIANKRIGH